MPSFPILMCVNVYTIEVHGLGTRGPPTHQPQNFAKSFPPRSVGSSSAPLCVTFMTSRHYIIIILFVISLLPPLVYNYSGEPNCYTLSNEFAWNIDILFIIYLFTLTNCFLCSANVFLYILVYFYVILLWLLQKNYVFFVFVFRNSGNLLFLDYFFLICYF